MDVAVLFNALLMLFGMLSIGFIAGKIRFMTEEMNKQISAFVVTVSNPLQILSSVLSGVYPMTNVELLKLTALMIPIYAVMIGISLLLRKLPHTEKKESDVLQFLFIFSNLGYMGYPLAEALFGAGGTFYVTVFVLAFQLVCWTYGVYLLSGDVKALSLRSFVSPCIIAALLAYFLYFTRIPCPSFLYKIIYQVGSVTSPLAMMIIGCSLAYMKAGQIFGKWQVYLVAFFRMLVMPLLFGLVLKQFMKDQVMLSVSLILLSMPSGTNATIMSYRFGADEKMASAGVFLTTLLSVGTVPLIMSILFR